MRAAVEQVPACRRRSRRARRRRRRRPRQAERGDVHFWSSTSDARPLQRSARPGGRVRRAGADRDARRVAQTTATARTRERGQYEHERRGRPRQARARPRPGPRRLQRHRRHARSAAAMRICLVYDCLFPYTVGGAERWYRNLALRLAADGHDVTYLTLRQWARGERGDLPGVRVVAAGPRMALYRGAGQRRILPPLVFGAGVLWHLLRHGRRYDVVHTRLVPVLLAARRRAGPARARLPARRRLVRAVARELLARVPRRRRRARSAAPSRRSACASRQRAFCFARADRRAAARRRRCAARSRCCEGSTPAR